MTKPEAVHKYKKKLTNLALALRKSATPAERKLWEQFKKIRLSLGLRFRRQQPIGPYIADFYCAHYKCIIEINGVSHEAKTKADTIREKYFNNIGVKVLRFTETEAQNNPQGVMESILSFLDIKTPPLTPPSRGGEHASLHQLAPSSSSSILSRLGEKTSAIKLSLRDGYFRVLEKLGNPHLSLPPIFHVAGTNGKGSTLAFMRAMLEAGGKTVHVYTSPHLVHFHERIRLAGALISEEKLCALLHECEHAAENEDLTFFEITTALAFTAFARTPADFVLLETGLGGRLDATNVTARPLASIITRISHDHREFLGNSIEAIAGEKAGIIKHGVPVIVAPQKELRVNAVLLEKTRELSAPLYQHGKDWHFERLENGGLAVSSGAQKIHAQRPSLLGAHQYENAATAIMALAATGLIDKQNTMLSGIERAAWPARLQKLVSGPLLSLLPAHAELWLDGGHNDSAGEALAEMAKEWKEQDDSPLYVICGMLANKDARAFMAPFAPYISGICAIEIPGEPKSMTASDLAYKANGLVPHIKSAPTLSDAASLLVQQNGVDTAKKARFLITGSLYLAGHVLQHHH